MYEIPNHDRMLDDPYQRDMDARVESREGDDDLDGLEEDLWDDDDD